jgi:hypothetical protein
MKVGIVADNYKLDQFKKELSIGGFTDFEIKPFCVGASSIFVITDESKLIALKGICTKVELHFKRSN